MSTSKPPCRYYPNCNKGDSCPFSHGSMVVQSSLPMNLTAHHFPIFYPTTEDASRILNPMLDSDLTEPPKFKTQLCKHFITKGFCVFENNCSFAHGTNEQKQHQAEKDAWFAQQRLKLGGPPPTFKTTLCQTLHEQGVCHRGAECPFAHGTIEQERALAQKAAWEDRQRKALDKPPTFKTVMCRYFYTEGYCKLQDRCTFAHGTKELEQGQAQKAAWEKAMSVPAQPDEASHQLQLQQQLKISPFECTEIPTGALDGEHPRTKLCPFWLNGEECRYENTCFSAHGKKEQDAALAHIQPTLDEVEQMDGKPQRRALTYLIYNGVMHLFPDRRPQAERLRATVIDKFLQIEPPRQLIALMRKLPVFVEVMTAFREGKDLDDPNVKRALASVREPSTSSLQRPLTIEASH